MKTSASAKRIARIWLMLILATLLAAALLLTWIAALADRERRAVQETEGGDVASEDAASAARVMATLDREGRDLLSALHVNFDLATRGADPSKSRMIVIRGDNSAGLTCSPTYLDPPAPTFRMVLPAAPVDRKGILAVLTPNGSLRIVYTSYGYDTDPEDLIIPSKSIDWKRVRTQDEFIVDASKFEALRPGANKPEPLFQQAGIYQFALLNGDRDLLEANGVPFRVVAGCVVHWQP